MKTGLHSLLAALTILAGVHSATAQPVTAFTYQGRLNNGTNPASGSYDLSFALYNAVTSGSQVGGTVTNLVVGVTNGLFTTTLDFGGAPMTGSPFWLPGSPLWLQILVRTNGNSTFTPLTPRQALTPTPYAIFAYTANAVSGTVPAAQISGTVPLAQLPSSVVTNNETGVSLTGAFSGNGGALTNLNVAGLSGVTNVWLLGGNSGTTPDVNYLGTADNQPLELHVNGSRVWRGEPGVSGVGAPNVIGGAQFNFVTAGVYGATIGGGGATNIHYGPYSHQFTNSVTGSFGTVGGGQNNTAGSDATVGGGGNNIASSDSATIGGGYGNTASASQSTVGGGYGNTASGSDSTVSGGSGNVASGFSVGLATVGGGMNNIATDLATVGGGYNNQATNTFATVPGGVYNVAGGRFSFAAGENAQATNDGAFVWADAQGLAFGSTTTNQFNVRANGGARFVTGGAGMTLDGQSVLTGNQAGVTLSNMTVSGSLTLPAIPTVYAGGNSLLYADGNYNFFAGASAGDYLAASGVHANTAIGFRALYSNYGGNYNTAEGCQALYVNNVGSFNTALGYQALAHSTTYSANTAVGYEALDQLNAGGGNIAMGPNAGYNLLAGTNNIYLGNWGISGENGVIRIGDVQTKTYIAGVIQAPSVTTITITGGSDLAEPFPISTPEQQVAEGAVVVIDEANPGHLKLASQPYDTRVAGVVSGANGVHPGIQMQQQGLLEGGRNVALTGRVYVQADTSNGAIRPGDLLTTSSAPGRAMKVSDHVRAQGAILGKAMSALDEGQGLVLVLVTLQ